MSGVQRYWKRELKSFTACEAKAFERKGVLVSGSVNTGFEMAVVGSLDSRLVRQRDVS